MSNIFEVSTVRPAPPLICEHANLPAFETLQDLEAFHSKAGGDHHPILAKWRCHFCGCWHYWSTSPTDSNGAFKAGADKVPERISRMAFETMRRAAK